MNKSIAHLERDELVLNNDLNDLLTIDRQIDSEGYDQPLPMSTNEEKQADDVMAQSIKVDIQFALRNKKKLFRQIKNAYSQFAVIVNVKSSLMMKSVVQMTPHYSNVRRKNSSTFSPYWKQTKLFSLSTPKFQIQWRAIPFVKCKCLTWKWNKSESQRTRKTKNLPRR